MSEKPRRDRLENLLVALRSKDRVPIQEVLNAMLEEIIQLRKELDVVRSRTQM